MSNEKTAISELIEFITDIDGTPLQDCNDIYDKAIQLQDKYAAYYQQSATDRIDKLLKLQIDECSNHLQRCARDKGQSSYEMEEWIKSTPLIDYYKQPAPQEKGVSEETFEVTRCECGNVVPIEYAKSNDEGQTSCPNCQYDYMAELLTEQKAKLKKQKSELKEWDQSFDLFHKATLRADELYRKYNPEYPVNRRQDMSKLVAFICDKIAELEREKEEIKKSISLIKDEYKVRKHGYEIMNKQSYSEPNYERGRIDSYEYVLQHFQSERGSGE